MGLDSLMYTSIFTKNGILTTESAGEKPHAGAYIVVLVLRCVVVTVSHAEVVPIEVDPGAAAQNPSTNDPSSPFLPLTSENNVSEHKPS